jgi:hypothetical protein
MTTTRTPRRLEPATEQLTLFPSSVPERFRLDDDTRRRGLRHVAILKAQLEARFPSSPPSPSPDPRDRTELGARAHEQAA